MCDSFSFTNLNTHCHATTQRHKSPYFIIFPYLCRTNSLKGSAFDGAINKYASGIFFRFYAIKLPDDKSNKR